MRHARLIGSLTLVAVLATPAAAQDRALGGFSYRAGVGFEPTQVVLGLDWTSGKFLHLFRVRPVGHFGFGEATTLEGGLDFLARFSVAEGKYGIYVGIGGVYGQAWDEGESDDFVSGVTVAGVQLPLHATWGTSVELRWMWDDSAPEFRILGVINP